MADPLFEDGGYIVPKRFDTPEWEGQIPPAPSWVVKFQDGRYAYAWGEDQVTAVRNLVNQVKFAVLEVVPASEFPTQPDPKYRIDFPVKVS